MSGDPEAHLTEDQGVMPNDEVPQYPMGQLRSFGRHVRNGAVRQAQSLGSLTDFIMYKAAPRLESPKQQLFVLGLGSPVRTPQSSLENHSVWVPRSTRLLGVFMVCSWMVLSSVVVFHNCYLMVDRKFPYPITMTTLHLLFQVVVTRLIGIRGNLRWSREVEIPYAMESDQCPTPTSPYFDESSNASDVEKQTPPLSPAGQPRIDLSNNNLKFVSPLPHTDSAGRTLALYEESGDQTNLPWEIYLKNIAPPAALFSVSLLLSNWAYLYITTSYIHMLKALSPVATLLASYALRTKSFAAGQFACALCISCGIITASMNEANFNLLGFYIQLAAVAVEALRVTMMQKIMSTNNFSIRLTPMQTVYYFSPICFGLNLFLVFAYEGFAPLIHAVHTLGYQLMTINCVLALVLTLVSAHLIGVSAMVLSLTKVGKNVLLVLGSCLLLGDPISFSQVVGYAIALAGLVLYKVAS